MKPKKIKQPTKKQLASYWKTLSEIEQQFNKKLYELERVMEKETGIEGLEFFWCDNSIVGIGNFDRTMKLIHRTY